MAGCYCLGEVYKMEDFMDESYSHEWTWCVKMINLDNGKSVQEVVIASSKSDAMTSMKHAIFDNNMSHKVSVIGATRYTLWN